MPPTIINRATDGRPLFFLLWYLATALALCADSCSEPAYAALVRVWGAM